MSTQQIPLTPCDSSQIFAHGYDPSTKTLALQFKRKGPTGERVAGSVYHYANCPPALYDEFRAADSLGRFFGERIKDNKDLPYVKIESVDQGA